MNNRNESVETIEGNSTDSIVVNDIAYSLAAYEGREITSNRNTIEYIKLSRDLINSYRKEMFVSDWVSHKIKSMDLLDKSKPKIVNLSIVLLQKLKALTC